MEIPVSRIFGKKSQNCQFKLKFSSWSILNMKDSMDLFIFFGFQPKIPILAKFGPKNQIWQFKVKRDT